ncbi:MAG: iron uptake porin, partial [Alkalinema sp. CAN_BIN05]|nr:iron uptake porin [Alkalinema sp. CAN_BIN05]
MAIQSLKAILIAPVLLGASVILSVAPAQAEVSVASLAQESNDMGAVTSVSQLSDVKPTDWAFQALQSLVERYGCIAGYPDKTYRGNRAMTRYEFAAGLNSCMDRVNDLIAASTADMVKKEDIATLRKLQEQFAAELATLRGRVDGLETKVATLEKQQFSTTTKLRGEVIFALAGALGETKATAAGGGGVALDKQTTFSDRVRLTLATSFTGKDTLLTRLAARNVPNMGTAIGSNMGRLSFGDGPAVSGSTDNGISIDKAYYRFPLGNARVTVDATGAEFYANMENFNGQLASDSTGTISRFGRFNPIYRYAQGGSGVTVNYSFTPQIGFSAGYLAKNASNPVAGDGLFNGGNAILAQLEYKASNNLGLGFTYVRGYDRNSTPAVLPAAPTDRPVVSGGTGSTLSNRPFGDVATTSDNFGIQGSFKLSNAINLGGWVGYTSANREAFGGGNASIWNWAVTLALPDLGKKGNLAGLIVGQQPKITSASAGVVPAGRERDSNLFVEGLYRYQL